MDTFTGFINTGKQWIMNEKWPLICPSEIRHAELKLEYIDFRLKRLAESVWHKIGEEIRIFIENL